MKIDKILEFESDVDANDGIARQAKIGYVCVGHNVTSVTSRENTRLRVSSHTLLFTKSAPDSLPASTRTGHYGDPIRPAVPLSSVPQCLRDIPAEAFDAPRNRQLQRTAA